MILVKMHEDRVYALLKVVCTLVFGTFGTGEVQLVAHVWSGVVLGIM